MVRRFCRVFVEAYLPTDTPRSVASLVGRKGKLSCLALCMSPGRVHFVTLFVRVRSSNITNIPRQPGTNAPTVNKDITHFSLMCIPPERAVRRPTCLDVFEHDKVTLSLPAEVSLLLQTPNLSLTCTPDVAASLIATAEALVNPRGKGIYATDETIEGIETRLLAAQATSSL